MYRASLGSDTDVVLAWVSDGTASQAGPWASISGIALGGSLVRGTSTEWSDIDLFCLTRAGEAVAEVIRAVLLTLPEGALLRPPRFIQGLGTLSSIVLPSLRPVQLIGVPERDATPSAMRRTSRILFDSSGVLTALCNQAVGAPDRPSSTQTEARELEFWSLTAQTLAALCGGQIWRAYGYLNRLQLVVLEEIRHQRGGIRMSDSPLFPATRFEQVVGADLTDSLRSMSSACTPRGIAAALDFIARGCGEHHLTFSATLSPLDAARCRAVRELVLTTTSSLITSSSPDRRPGQAPT
jgi:Nucleotidyltransferase domain